MKTSYLNQDPDAKHDPATFQVDLEASCRLKISELFQAVLEAEVDDVLERLRYEHRWRDSKDGYRDGYDRRRTITSSRGLIDVRKPRVRGTTFFSAVLPKHERRLRTVDRSLTDLWLDGLATRDFEGTLRAFLGADAPLLAATITRRNKELLNDFSSWSAGISKTRTLFSAGQMACIWEPVPTMSVA